MSTVELVLLIAAGWMALAALTWALLLQPLFMVAKRADDLSGRVDHKRGALAVSSGEWGVSVGGTAGRSANGVGGAAAGAPGLPSLRASGYLSIVLERLAMHACRMLAGDEACIFVRGRGDGDAMFVPVAGAGVDPDLIGQRLWADSGPLGTALAMGRPTVVPHDGRLGGPQTPAVVGGGCVAVAPVSFGGRTRGGLSVTVPGAAGFGLPKLGLLGELAEPVGRALMHHERRELGSSDPQLEVEGLLRTVERIEPETGRHGLDVAEIAQTLVEALGLAPADRLELALGARLHDVGKLRVPPQILGKRGLLTDAEWQVMRLHPLWGAEMVASIPGLEAVSVIVRCHHERYDGGGYPDGLAGEQIPLASRVVALCDAFSAMTSDRPYRPAVDNAAALRELAAGAGTQFDPELTARFARAAGSVEVASPA